MKITDAIRGEHAVYYAWLDEFVNLLEADEPAVAIPEFAALFQSALGGHAMLEDQLLFARLESIEGAEEPLAAVRDDHHRLNNALGELCEIDDTAEARRRGEEVVALAREHFGREEETIFPLAERQLDEDVLLEAGRTWADRRDVDLE